MHAAWILYTQYGKNPLGGVQVGDDPCMAMVPHAVGMVHYIIIATILCVLR